MDFDFNSMHDALKLAGNAGAATQNLAKGLEAIKALFKGSEVGADTNVKLLLSEMTLQIANAQLSNSDLKLTLAALQDELAKAQRFQSDLERYYLWETPSGSIVYRLEGFAQGGEPMHYLCPGCIESKRKSILQGDEKWRNCPACKTEYPFSGMGDRSLTVI